MPDNIGRARRKAGSARECSDDSAAFRSLPVVAVATAGRVVAEESKKSKGAAEHFTGTVRVDPLSEAPEPTRWQKPNVLVLERHEYYEKLKPTEIDNVKFESIHGFDRLYEITATIDPDGKATVVWKLRKDRP
jgi:hypothetical protein